MNDLNVRLYDLDVFFYFSSVCFLFFIVNYYINSKNSYIKKILFLLRTFSLIIIVLILLNPIINYKVEHYDNRALDIYLDNSSSIKKNISNYKKK